MQEIQNHSDTELIDLLSTETARLSKLLIDPPLKEEYNKCKLYIRALMVEIEQRKLFKKDGTVNERDIFFKPD